jgi:hypothetical protein
MPRYAKKRAYDDESPDSGPEVTAKPAKKSKAAVTSSSSGSGKDADGNLYWEVGMQCFLVTLHHALVAACYLHLLLLTGDGSVQLSPKRRVAINNFKGQTLIAIREYYEADGEMKPGKKVSCRRHQPCKRVGSAQAC